MIIKCIHTWNWVWISLKLKNKIISRFLWIYIYMLFPMFQRLSIALCWMLNKPEKPRKMLETRNSARHHCSNKRSRKERKRSENLIWKNIKFPVNKTAIISILISTVVPCPFAVFTVYFSWIAPLYVGALSSSRVRTERVLKWVWNKLIK